MMEVVLTRLRDFSCKTTTFVTCKPPGKSACRDPQTRSHHVREGHTAGGESSKLDIESALAWLRRELVRLPFSDQVLTAVSEVGRKYQTFYYFDFTQRICD